MGNSLADDRATLISLNQATHVAGVEFRDALCTSLGFFAQALDQGRLRCSDEHTPLLTGYMVKFAAAATAHLRLLSQDTGAMYGGENQEGGMAFATGVVHVFDEAVKKQVFFGHGL